MDPDSTPGLRGPTGPGRKFGLASFTFQSTTGGFVGEAMAKAAITEFDQKYPNRLIYNRTEVKNTADATAIVLSYLTSADDEVSLWQKFSEIARRTGL